jgi:deoxyribodipyrimidine photo-lyase
MNIWWIRRDLRLTDNQAFHEALQNGEKVLPVFILDEHLLKSHAEKRQAFLYSGLHSLKHNLQRLGSDLIIRKGDPETEILRLVEECSVQKVFAEEDVTPYARRRDHSIAQRTDLHLIHGIGVHPSYAVTRSDGKPYTVFTPYCKAWKAFPLVDTLPLLPTPAVLPSIPDLYSEEIPELPHLPLFPANEQEAIRRLNSFLDGRIFTYSDSRNRLDEEGTSALSPYLHFGMLSPRQVYIGAIQAWKNSPDAIAKAGCETWINELIWRDFYQSILWYFPEALSQSLKVAYRNIPWRQAPEEFLAWQQGNTGYPVVDAGMRQLASTGWIHNRVRMIAASFLVKHLLINWQEGERWFMRLLIDGDLAANNGGWQWVAGTGTDAAPYFRIFNPVTQGEKFDPEGKYIRKWIPELANVPAKFIHKPWEMPPAEQQKYHAVIGQDYPVPMVDHRFARERALRMYKKA